MKKIGYIESLKKEVDLLSEDESIFSGFIKKNNILNIVQSSSPEIQYNYSYFNMEECLYTLERSKNLDYSNVTFLRTENGYINKVYVGNKDVTEFLNKTPAFTPDFQLVKEKDGYLSLLEGDYDILVNLINLGFINYKSPIKLFLSHDDSEIPTQSEFELVAERNFAVSLTKNKKLKTNFVPVIIDENICLIDQSNLFDYDDNINIYYSKGSFVFIPEKLLTTSPQFYKKRYNINKKLITKFERSIVDLINKSDDVIFYKGNS